MSKTMKVNKANLQEALTIVKPGLASKEMIEQSTSFAFLGDRVVTYNDSISISQTVEGVNLKGAIEASELYNLLSKITKDEISFEEKGEGSLVLKAGRSKAGFTLHKEIKLPLDEISLDSEWFKLPKEFCTAVRKVMSSASNDMSRPVLTAVHVSKKGWIEASDSLRASRFKLAKKLKCPSFLLPTSAAIPLLKINPTEMCISNGWIHFKNDTGTIFSARSLEGDFPDIDHLFKMKSEKAFLFPKGLDDIVNRAEPFYKRPHILQEKVTVLIEKNSIQVKAVTETSNSWFKEEMKCEKIDDMSFSMPPSLLLDILNAEAAVQVNDRFLSFTDGNWSYVCCTNLIE